MEVKQIEGFSGYFISSEGRVYCNLGKGNRGRGRIVKLYEIKGRPTKNGYLRVYMRRNSDNKRVDMYIHRIVATHFLSNPHNHKYVNHIDCDRQNNDYRNLEWVTARQNIKHAMLVGNLDRDIYTGRYKRKI